MCVSGKLSWNSIWGSWYEKLIRFVGDEKTFHQTNADYNAGQTTVAAMIIVLERFSLGIYTMLWQLKYSESG